MYHKVMFSKGTERTAGLLVDANTIDVTDMARVSRLFPYGEAYKMQRYHVSPAFATLAEAFAYQFDVQQ